MIIVDQHTRDRIVKELQGSLGNEERLALDAWRKADPLNEIEYQRYVEVWFMTTQPPASELPPNTTDAWNRFNLRLDNVDHQDRPKTGKIKPMGFWLRAVAAVGLLVVSAWYFWPNETHSGIVFTAEDKTMTTTLADGSTIILKEGATMTVDGSFTSSTERLVVLEGQAYFDVTRMETKPFIAQAGDLRVEVLGTSFYVNTNLANDGGDVAVASGKVKVTHLPTGQEWTLLENQGVTCVEGRCNTYTVGERKSNEWAWHTGKLIFQGTKLEEVLAVLESHFGRKIRLTRTELMPCRFTGRFQEDTLEDVLRTISNTFQMTLKSSPEGVYYLTGGNCN